MKNLKILVPIDFSELSIRALSAAQVFANLFDGSITPFHSYVPISELDGPYMLGLGPTASEDYEEMEKVMKERLNEVLNEHIEEKYRRTPIISIGNPAHCIIETAKDFDMIVMSTHGRTGFTRFFLGSVAEKVLRLSHVPVLILDKESQMDSINKIMVTTDFSENSKSAFTYAKDLAKASQAEVELIHILNFDSQHDEEPEESKISLREQRLKILAKEELHEINDLITTKVIVSSDTAHESILRYTLNNQIDLVVIATVGRTGIDYLMMGSTTANVVRHVKCPVLSINPKKKREVDA